MQKYLTSLEQVCATSVYGAVSRELEGKGGLYLEGASITQHLCPPDGDGVEYSYGSWAFDREKEEALWELSKTMVGSQIKRKSQAVRNGFGWVWPGRPSPLKICEPHKFVDVLHLNVLD